MVTDVVHVMAVMGFKSGLVNYRQEKLYLCIFVHFRNSRGFSLSDTDSVSFHAGHSVRKSHLTSFGLLLEYFSNLHIFKHKQPVDDLFADSWDVCV